MRNLSDFAPRVHRFLDFRKIWNVRDQISGRKLKNFGKISIRFGTKKYQISDRNLFEMWSEFVCHADQHKNERTSVNGVKMWWNVYVYLQDFFKIPIRFGMEMWLISVRNLIETYEISTRFGKFRGSENLKKRKNKAKERKKEKERGTELATFSSTAIDRGICIVDSALKKRRSTSLRKHRARQQKNVRAPKTAMRWFY